MSFSPFEVLCLCATVAVAPLVLALLGRGPRRHPSNRVLLTLLAVNGLLLVRASLMLRGLMPPTEAPWVFLGGASLFFVLPPLVYLYAVHLLEPARPLGADSARHALPALLAFAVLAALFLVRSGADPAAFPTTRATYVSYLVALHAVFGGYAYAAVRAVAQARKQRVEPERWRWTVAVLGLFGAHWGFSASAGVLSLTALPEGVILTLEALSIVTLIVFCGAATFLGLRRLPLFADPLPSPRYAGSSLDAAALVHHAKRLDAHLRDARPYLDPTLTAERLAEALALTPRELSQVLSDGLGRSFFDVLNGYRVAEAQRLLADPDRAGATILELGFEAGFNSKSAFNRAFKQATGETPTAFRRAALGEPMAATSRAA